MWQFLMLSVYPFPLTTWGAATCLMPGEENLLWQVRVSHADHIANPLELLFCNSGSDGGGFDAFRTCPLALIMKIS